MSHQATHWLADLEPGMVTASEFRILFHLCDCHNPAKGCYPTQAYLRDRANVSNGTVNSALRSLEDKGLITRRRQYDDKRKKALPTRYYLGFEIGEADHTPNSGDRSEAVSNLDHNQSPICATTSLQPAGDKPVKEPVNEAVAAAAGTSLKDFEPDEELRRWAFSQGFTDYDIEEETAKFRIWWSDKVNMPSSLSLAWRKWMKDDLAYRANPNKRQTTRPRRRSPILEELKRREARESAEREAAGGVE